jgi:hypothetical protein
MVRSRILLCACLASACTEPNPDYDADAAAALCAGGERRCGPTSKPQVCTKLDDGSYAWSDEFCANGGTCESGRCEAPAGAAACVRDSDCGGLLCVPFASQTELGHFCAPPTGSLPGGTTCQSSPDCRSALCQRQTSGSALCFTACDTTADCPGDLQCVDADATITGVRGKLRGCLAP